MHAHSIERWQHEHQFLGTAHGRNEQRTWFAVALTGAMMVAEIVAGRLYGSMALTADGWHMATHVTAFGISAGAYALARRHRTNSRFAFGTGKLGDLAAFASAIVLALVAAAIAWESAERIAVPAPIRFGEAMLVAAIGLAVNVVCAWLLHEGGTHGHAHGHQSRAHPHDDSHEHGHGHGHAHPHRHGHAHRDHNLRSAYLHVLADALTSVLAIVGLAAGALLGWRWTDPAVGIAGSLVIAGWAWSLARDAGAVLLDMVPDPALAGRVRGALEVEGDRVADLHLWRVGPGHCAAVVSIVSDDPAEPARYKRRLAGIEALSHVTVEVHRCAGHDHAG